MTEEKAKPKSLISIGFNLGIGFIFGAMTGIYLIKTFFSIIDLIIALLIDSSIKV